MDGSREKFFKTAVKVFEFLEKDHAYKRMPEIIEDNKGPGDLELIVRYVGTVVAVDVSWYYDIAVMNVVFTELADGKFPSTRHFWGNTPGKPKATDLFTLIEMNKANPRDFILGDVTRLELAKIRERAELIKTDMEAVLQNLKKLCIEHASEIINGDVSIFPVAVKYQQKIIDRGSSTR